MDIKAQAIKDDTNPSKLDWDQRKSTGAYRGADEGMHVKTLAEVRVDDATGDILTNPDKLAEFVQPGDCILDVVNRVGAMLKVDKIVPGSVGVVLPWSGLAVMAYDND